ncbi:hypothetical protein ACF2G4_06590 [Pantoea sp. C3]|uniref:hypothetical protein n=1 Tax=Pantoea phytostimulans TaxID=2769024 RepID=UPI0038F7478C
MIEWRAYINELDESGSLDLIACNKVEVREIDSLSFVIILEQADFTILGAPFIVIGDIPVAVVYDGNNESGDYIYISKEPLSSWQSKYFYNFFGETEVFLSFEKKRVSFKSVRFDILARKENAILAEKMLGFLTENMEDAVAICFSRSKAGSKLDGDENHHFNKLDIIQKAILFFERSLPSFSKENKHSLKNELVLALQGNPTGPDSIYWALSNLDKLSAATHENVNVSFNNRGYFFERLPKEVSVKDYDLFENRVINHFFAHAENFLIYLIGMYKDKIESKGTHPYSEFIRFDHTMTRFSDMAINIKIKDIEGLIFRIKMVKHSYSKTIPSKTNKLTLPRLTSYVAKNSHYREAFSLVESCYRSNAPKLDGNNILLGLKNLSIIYEISSLILIHKIILNTFNVNLVQQGYREYSEDLPFGGIEKNRPNGFVNNYFSYSNEEYNIELFYEAKIYPLSSNSRTGDFIDTSNKIRNGFGKHHFCPDFILKIDSKKWGRPLNLILDAKYKDLETIKDYDILPLTSKYLLNIHSIDNKGFLKISPIDMLIILFAHQKKGRVLRTVSQRHCITGDNPVLPQSTGIFFFPEDTYLLEEHLQSLIIHMDKIYKT